MTTKQTQCLLTYLGYDTGGVDGVVGPKTNSALAAFAKSVNLREGDDIGQRLKQAIADAADPAADPGWDSIKYFSRTEFRCPCPRCGGFPVEPSVKLVKMADKVRSHFGKPAIISSGVRCAAHNVEVGGVANSRHLKGWAADLAIPGVTAESLNAYVGSLPECAYHYAIDGSFVHMDVVE